MKKITDERLIMKNLQHIRIAFIIQTLGILAILGYDLVTKGIDGMRENPLWLVFMITSIVYAYLSMGISVDYEDERKSAKKSLVLSLGVVALIAIIIGICIALTDGPMNGVIIGGIIFLCFLPSALFVYYLRRKKYCE